MSKLTIKLTDTPKPLPDLKTLEFGKASPLSCICAFPRTHHDAQTFTDHMAIVAHHPTSGWSAPEIKPYGPLTIDPAASCFQYGCGVFEGFKVRTLPLSTNNR